MESTLPRILWETLGVTGAVIFYGRFYVQWWASERAKRSVIPVAFWYMSATGSVLQFIYAVHIVSPGGAFGQCFNIVVYARNLVHIWREQGKLTRALNVGVHAAAGAIVLLAAAFMVSTWLQEIHANRALPVEAATRNWFWLGVWAVGQILFSLRFAIQWLATELRRRSVMPPIFWHLSLIAAALQALSFVQRAEWIFAAGMAATIVIYARNLYFVHRAPAEGQPVPADARNEP